MKHRLQHAAPMDQLRQELREVVRANRISWEAANVEAAP